MTDKKQSDGPAHLQTAPLSSNPEVEVYTLVPQWRTYFTIVVLLVTNVTAVSLPIEYTEARAGCVILATALLWVTEGMPLMLTALLPAVMFPLAGILDSKTVCSKYFSFLNILMLMSFIMAEGVEACNLHRRIALKILSVLGRGEALLIMGAMFTAWLLSMFMENTAVTAMMLPIIGAIINSLREIDNDLISISGKGRRGSGRRGSTWSSVTANAEDEAKEELIDPQEDTPEFKWFCKGLILAIPYGATIGGMATLTGTPPNLVMKAAYESDFPDAPPMSYGKWMYLFSPLSFLLLIVSWFVLVVFYARKSLWSLIRLRPCLDTLGLDEETKKWRNINNQIQEKYAALGPFRFAETAMFAMSGMLVVLWLTRDPEGLTGWGKAHENAFGEDKTFLDDAWIVILWVCLLFIIPKENPLQGGLWFNAPPGTELKRMPRLLDMQTVMTKTPWNVPFILGGGFAIAEGCTKSNLANWLGSQFEFLEGSEMWLMALVISVIVAILTEFTSNTATANILMPILSSMSLKIKVHPLYLMMIGAQASNLSFCLPSATGPNVVVFSFKEITVLDMLRTGVLIKLVCIPVTVLAASTWITSIAGLEEFPDWANSTLNSL